MKHILAYAKSHGGLLTILSGTGRISARRKGGRRTNAHPYVKGTVVNVRFETGTMGERSAGREIETPFRFD